MNEDYKNHLMRAFQNNKRPDGRKLEEYRDISIELGVSETAEGSARVKIGNTEVIVGVKLELGQPYPDRPNEGTIITGAELLPLSSPNFETGPPGIFGIEVARVVDRAIRESQALDTKKLCLVEGEKVWTILIDVCTINDEGNIFDAASLGAIAALKDTRFPLIENNTINYRERSDEHLPVTKLPVLVTVLKYGDALIVDPLSMEEEAYDARLSVATTNDGTICAMQKGGDGTLTIDDVKKMVDLCTAKAKELREHLQKVL